MITTRFSTPRPPTARPPLGQEDVRAERHVRAQRVHVTVQPRVEILRRPATIIAIAAAAIADACDPGVEVRVEEEHQRACTPNYPGFFTLDQSNA